MKVAKIINEESELRLLRDKNKNKKIVLTSGCFDLLHYDLIELADGQTVLIKGNRQEII